MARPSVDEQLRVLWAVALGAIVWDDTDKDWYLGSKAIHPILVRLRTRGLVSMFPQLQGQDWHLTDAGRELISRTDFKE